MRTDLTIVSANPAFTQITGYRAEDMLGQTPRLLDTGLEEEPFSPSRCQRIAGGCGRPGRQVIRSRTGAFVDVAVTLSPVSDDEGRTTGYVALYCDLREQVAHERKLTGLLEAQRTASKELEAAREKADEANQAKSRLVAAVSHEIRTPLAGLMGTLDLLSGSKLDGEAGELAQVAKATASGTLDVLNDVLDFAKIEAGRLELEHLAFDATALVRGVDGVFRAQAKERGLRLELQLPPEPMWVCGDPTRLRQVLLNLVGNALKFTREGAVTVSLETRAAAEPRRQLHFSVRDTGMGIAAGTRATLFRPFVQGDASRSRTHGGTGLGLSISRQLVDAMGGLLDVETTEGVGSRFFFSLELPAAAPATAKPPSRERWEALAGRRVLLAEDNPVLRMVVSRLLQRLGCAVTVAEDGAAALAALTRERPFDAVLMDCEMPGMDGFAATRAIRASAAPWRELPIIAITANTGDEDRVACRASGMSGYLAKPVKEESLAGTLLEALGSTPPAPTAA